jgi:hypothetical protein
MTSASDLVKSLGQKSKRKEQEVKSYSEWPKCSAPGCPLRTTIKADDCTCYFHFRKKHGLEGECMTEAIKENLGLLNKHAKMTFWSVNTWKEKRAQILGWDALPCTEEELNNPTMYLNKFKKWINKVIEDRSRELYNNQ